MDRLLKVGPDQPFLEVWKVFGRRQPDPPEVDVLVAGDEDGQGSAGHDVDVVGGGAADKDDKDPLEVVELSRRLHHARLHLRQVGGAGRHEKEHVGVEPEEMIFQLPTHSSFNIRCFHKYASNPAKNEN